MNDEFKTTVLQDYITTALSDPPSVDHFDPTLSSSTPTNYMSPVTSAASTPPHLTQSNTSMASYAAPVQISSQPYNMSLSAYPRRAEHSYYHHPYNLGAPPPPPGFPKVRAPQLPTAALVQPSSASIPDSTNEPDAPPSGTGGQRKRPKYTRSKKGCLTCRSKKIKCDERQPMCTRCEHGHRECTWPEAVLPRRPKGAVRGVGGDEDDGEDDGRRPSIAGSTVSTQFPTSATSTHFSSGIPGNSPFEPAPPRRDVFESDVYPAGSQFSMPVIPANARPFYPRAPVTGQEFYPVTTINGQPVDDYEFPPRTYGPGSSSGSRGGGSGGYSNGVLYATGPPGAVTNFNGDLRRASWDSSAPTDGRRPSWDATSMAGGAHTSSVGSPASSSLGLGGLSRALVGGSNNTTAGGPSGASQAGSGGNGLMLFQSPDPLSPFFRSVQERNLVGNLSSFAPLSLPLSTAPSSFSSPFSSSRSSSASSYFSNPYDASTLASSSSPVLSTASSTDFGMTPEGIAYRKNSYPHLFPTLLPQPLAIEPPAPIAPQGRSLLDVDGQSSVEYLGLSENPATMSEQVEWLAPPSLDIRPMSSPDEEGFTSWTAYS